jgi:hypothetical protein
MGETGEEREVQRFNRPMAGFKGSRKERSALGALSGERFVNRKQ